MDCLLSILKEWIKGANSTRARGVWIELDKTKVVVRLRDRETATGHMATLDIYFDWLQIDQMNAVEEFIRHRMASAFDELAQSLKERKSK